MNYTKSLVDQFTFVILLAIREPERFERQRFARDSIIALLAFAYSVWAIAGSGKDIIAKGFVLLMCGIPVYVYIMWRQSREREFTPETDTPEASPAATASNGGRPVAALPDSS